jgi:hypothetical protein
MVRYVPTMRGALSSIPVKEEFYRLRIYSDEEKSFNFFSNAIIFKTHFIMRYFAFYHGFKLVQRIRWFFTIYRIIYFALKRKMLFHGLRPFFWPIPFKTREFIPIMNLKFILNACAGKTVQHHAKILLGYIPTIISFPIIFVIYKI